MNNEDKLVMYEAQAIAVEKQIELNKLKREKEELAERLRRLELQVGAFRRIDQLWDF